MSTDKANRAIDQTTRESVERTTAGGRQAIERRLTELQQEWDIDRVLTLNFAALVFAQLVAARKDRRWLWGPPIQTPFLLMHATVGWSSGAVVPAIGIPDAIRDPSRARSIAPAVRRTPGLDRYSLRSVT
ncbi:MAG: hypothetical protein LC804_22240 [Acidobacteria bacterium]|nr:hypothetical protein [Acidobacteriota bacterium]